MRIFNIKYIWYDGDEGQTYLAKLVDKPQFEKDMKEATIFVESLIGHKVEGDYIGKGYEVECLPEFYEQIIFFLINKKGYVECDNEDSEYFIGDLDSEKKITVERVSTELRRKVL